MPRLARLALTTVRLTGLTLLILGVIIWTGHGAGLVNAHMGVGLLFVLALWCLAAVGTRTGVRVGLTLRAVVWGIVVLWFGMVQRQMWPGSNHTYIRVLHLIVGLVAIGVAEVLGARMRRGVEAKGR